MASIKVFFAVAAAATFLFVFVEAQELSCLPDVCSCPPSHFCAAASANIGQAPESCACTLEDSVSSSDDDNLDCTNACQCPPSYECAAVVARPGSGTQACACTLNGFVTITKS